MGTHWHHYGGKRFDKYVLKVDGSGGLPLRNRRFPRKLYQDKSMFLNAKSAPQNRCAVSETASGNSYAFQKPSESEQPCSSPLNKFLGTDANELFTPPRCSNDEYIPTSSQGRSPDLTVSDKQQAMSKQLFTPRKSFPVNSKLSSAGAPTQPCGALTNLYKSWLTNTFGQTDETI